MAITKISQYNSSPTDETDYQAQNEHLQAFINQLNSGAFIVSQTSTTTEPVITQGTYIQMGGTVYIVDTEDYAVQGTITSGSTNYIYLTESGDNLVATWTTDISGYSWNSVYNCLSDGTNFVLPYSVYYDGTNYILNKFEGYNKALNSLKIYNTDDISPSSTDNPFQIGEDDSQNMAFDTNQILCRAGDGSTFGSLNINSDEVTSTYGTVRLGNILPILEPTSGTQTFAAESTWTPSRGVYTFTSSSEAMELSVNNGSNYTEMYSGTFFCRWFKCDNKK